MLGRRESEREREKPSLEILCRRRQARAKASSKGPDLRGTDTALAPFFEKPYSVNELPYLLYLPTVLSTITPTACTTWIEIGERGYTGPTAQQQCNARTKAQVRSIGREVAVSHVARTTDRYMKGSAVPSDGSEYQEPGVDESRRERIVSMWY